MSGLLSLMVSHNFMPVVVRPTASKDSTTEDTFTVSVIFLSIKPFLAKTSSLSFSSLTSSPKHHLSFCSPQNVNEIVPNPSTAQQSSGRRNALFTSKYCHRFCAPGRFVGT
ncbi:hypothetical protein ACB098_12G137400 [Castanea mollissima]